MPYCTVLLCYTPLLYCTVLNYDVLSDSLSLSILIFSSFLIFSTLFLSFCRLEEGSITYSRLGDSTYSRESAPVGDVSRWQIVQVRVGGIGGREREEKEGRERREGL